ncbi:MAG: class I SAM-dependent methyltransferase [Leptospiraceae bacterium]|nr:class I SAM-dependent methyltransferase [Leptospiraceae bacterium]
MLNEVILELFPENGRDILNLFELSKVEQYYSFLLEKDEEGGFFSRTDREHILKRHIIESLYHVYKIFKSITVSRETVILDFGTGPGLPGFLFFCLKQPPEIIFVDSQKKRLSLLETFVKQNFKINEISFYYSRIEDLKIPGVDIIVSRASIPYPWSAEVCVKLLKKGGFFIPFLGAKKNDSEIESKLLNNLGLVCEKSLDLNELNFLGKRTVKFLKKRKEANYGFPRNWKLISKEIKQKNE